MLLEQSKINEIIVELINTIGGDNFPSTLAEQIRKLVSYDSLVIMLYRDNALPDIIHDEI